ncbi:hypothetical protein AB0D38_32780, partial [Streptomyces sp. NPDC048279]
DCDNRGGSQDAERHLAGLGRTRITHISGLSLAVGSGAAVRAATLAGYGVRPCLRGLWLARCDTVIRLTDRLEGRDDSPLPLLRTQLRRAWEAIMLERVSDLREDDTDEEP